MGFVDNWVTDSKQLLLATERRLLVWNNDDFVNSEVKYNIFTNTTNS